MHKFDDAKIFLERSLPHAPKESIERKGKECPEEDELDIILKEIEEEEKLKDEEQDEEILDYKSYSYRLIGHIYGCKNEYHNAVSALLLAVELSPKYYVAFYDLAQYCAQTLNKETCLSALKN
ncbi:MAG: hypothetical protein MUO72_20510, partial [Bacteroidales bacterium]|nr:hypothetical protein [Bacteroidales bacterium]